MLKNMAGDWRYEKRNQDMWKKKPRLHTRKPDPTKEWESGFGIEKEDKQISIEQMTTQITYEILREKKAPTRKLHSKSSTQSGKQNTKIPHARRMKSLVETEPQSNIN